MVEWGGHHGGWGGFGPPSYIVKKCPVYFPLKRCQSSNGYGYEDERLSHYFIFDFKSLLYAF